MRIEIFSTDRLGISQEILAVCAEHSWNIKAVEVSTGTVYLHLELSEVLFQQVQHSIMAVGGVSQCSLIASLPSESREEHLLALLGRIPDAIFDLDNKGTILLANQSAFDLVGNKMLIGKSIEQVLEIRLDDVLAPTASNFEVSVQGKTFIAEVHPVLVKELVSGVVLSLKQFKQLGRQIAFMQQHKKQHIDHILGESEAITLIRQQIEQFAPLDLPVLIRGETGTGKELLARAIHHASNRQAAPFLAINCAALPEHLLESELFGYASGAFTGAQKGGKPGLFELAEGGTVFLDEIAEMSGYLQAKLLRFLQDFHYRRVGGTQELKANVRILSASHQNLTELITSKQFRQDLFYRLNVLQVELPPLRERIDDIVLLAQHFINDAANQVNKELPYLTEQALLALKAYSWPGNIRQLQNILFRLVALATEPEISPSTINIILANDEQKNDWQSKNESLVTLENQDAIAGEIKDWASAQAAFEKRLLMQLYPLFPSTRKLAQRLSVSHNKIAMKLKRYKITD